MLHFFALKFCTAAMVFFAAARHYQVHFLDFCLKQC